MQHLYGTKPEGSSWKDNKEKKKKHYFRLVMSAEKAQALTLKNSWLSALTKMALTTSLSTSPNDTWPGR